MRDPDLLFRPVSELRQLLHNRALSAVELAQATLDHVERLQPRLNAFITITHEAALAAAHQADRELSGQSAGESQSLRPLLGIPYSVKDLTYTAGVRTTMGSHTHADFVPDEDAIPVARLKAAGAVLIGKTTTPAFGHKPITEGKFFGETLNPWNTKHTCGGSSGGAGAAVAAGMAPLALGTDGGGSVRIPPKVALPGSA